VVPADPEKGLPPGVIFTLRNRHPGVNLHHANRLHPFYLVYIGQQGEIVAHHTEPKRLLDLARTACKGRSEPVREVSDPFNRETDDGRDMGVYSALLDAAIHSMLERKRESEIDSLFTPGHTTALREPVAGLDDFELVAFVVVRPAS
jgi:hypothetical protein